MLFVLRFCQSSKQANTKKTEKKHTSKPRTIFNLSEAKASKSSNGKWGKGKQCPNWDNLAYTFPLLLGSATMQQMAIYSVY